MPSVAGILSWRAISMNGYNFEAGSSNKVERVRCNGRPAQPRRGVCAMSPAQRRRLRAGDRGCANSASNSSSQQED